MRTAAPTEPLREGPGRPERDRARVALALLLAVGAAYLLAGLGAGSLENSDDAIHAALARADTVRLLAPGELARLAAAHDPFRVLTMRERVPAVLAAGRALPAGARLEVLAHGDLALVCHAR